MTESEEKTELTHDLKLHSTASNKPHALRLVPVLLLLFANLSLWEKRGTWEIPPRPPLRRRRIPLGRREKSSQEPSETLKTTTKT